ncbi:MAG: 5'-methylthioadenosine/S-adenosylhomocysteine nucleosidase, partial [Burkholderiales bacterium]|nr:5'-methylthioadenosine/S-adenosylhomocysteine nucleosidase [Burkholderiales bacterium]
QYLIDKCEVEMIINVGVAGCLTESLTFGDVVVATDLVQHDVNVLAFGIPIGQIPRMDVFSFVSHADLLACAMTVKPDNFLLLSGRIVSGDQFIDDSDKAKYLAQEFGALACEMEGAAVAHTCYVNSTPFVVIRAISDLAGREDKFAIHSFDELKIMVADRSSYIVKQMLLSKLFS